MSDRLYRNMAAYYDCLDKISALRAQANDLKAAILREAQDGRYRDYKVGTCKSVWIEVQAYRRRGYRYVKRTNR